MVKTIQQAVKHHDQYQMEVKLDYELFPSQKTEYQIATYIFVPHHLGIKPATYSKLNFYNDINSYIRLKTPEFNLRQITESDQSPLHKIEEMVKDIDWVSDTTKQNQLIIQFKLLAAMLKSAIREHFTLIEKRIAEAEASPHAKTHHLIHNLVEDFLTETDRITSRYRELYAPFNLPNLPEEIFTAYTFTDESISILVEENSVEMYQIVSDYLKKTNRSDFMERLYERVEKETKYRKTRGYQSILHEEGINEDYLYRTSTLKKYSSSVLFLDTEVSPEAKNLKQLSFAIAAGISMIFATALAFFFQQRFGNLTFPFFISLVIGYMFKDRIKELGRAIFSKQLEDRFADRRITIRTQDGTHKLGIMKEKFQFVDEEDVPKSVLRSRARDKITDLYNDGRGEYIIKYTKEIMLNTDAFDRVFPDYPTITGINDILRYDIRPFLTKMAEPRQSRLTLRERELQEVYVDKVYHLHFISRYKSSLPSTDKVNRHLRLVLNQKGIKRIEEIGHFV